MSSTSTVSSPRAGALDGWPDGMRIILRRERPYPGDGIAGQCLDDAEGHRLTALVAITARALTLHVKNPLAWVALFTAGHRRVASCHAPQRQNQPTTGSTPPDGDRPDPHGRLGLAMLGERSSKAVAPSPGSSDSGLVMTRLVL